MNFPFQLHFPKSSKVGQHGNNTDGSRSKTETTQRFLEAERRVLCVSVLDGGRLPNQLSVPSEVLHENSLRVFMQVRFLISVPDGLENAGDS